VKEGDSISVDGVCLTVKKFSQGIGVFDAVYETIKRTTLAEVRNGRKVNLERAIPVNGRFDGHIVLGHVDGTGKIRGLSKGEKEVILTIDYPDELKPYIAEKGSIAIDGISLTIAGIHKNTLSIALIPYTVENTSLKYKRTGDRVNLEVDVVARYIKRIMEVDGGKV
ncbi:riboflavin synthase, partial [bacterium]